MGVCEVCGLPLELCICEEMAKEAQRIRISVVKRKYKKSVTVIEGIDDKKVNLDDLAKMLKSHLACGGTAKDGKIELQGEHRARVKEVLQKQGFGEIEEV